MPYAFLYYDPAKVTYNDELMAGIQGATAAALDCSAEGGRITPAEVGVIPLQMPTGSLPDGLAALVKVEARNYPERVVNIDDRTHIFEGVLTEFFPSGVRFEGWIFLGAAGWCQSVGTRD